MIDYTKMTKAQLIELLAEKDEEIQDKWPEWCVYVGVLVHAPDQEKAIEQVSEAIYPCGYDFEINNVEEL